jgi:hypothetical protein
VTRTERVLSGLGRLLEVAAVATLAFLVAAGIEQCSSGPPRPTSTFRPSYAAPADSLPEIPESLLTREAWWIVDSTTTNGGEWW